MFRDRRSGLKDEDDCLVTGDSGDGPGEGSVMLEESIVDIVVVGEESVESDAEVEVLSRCWWWKFEYGGGVFEALCRCGNFPFIASPFSYDLPLAMTVTP